MLATYVATIDRLINSNGINHHKYADNTHTTDYILQTTHYRRQTTADRLEQEDRLQMTDWNKKTDYILQTTHYRRQTTADRLEQEDRLQLTDWNKKTDYR